MARKLKRLHLDKRLVVLAVLVVLAIVIAIGYAAKGNKKTNVIIPSTSSAAKTQEKGSDNQSSNSSTGNSDTTNTAPSKDSSSSQSSNLLTPSGNFVSNHTPGQKGSPLDENSVCNTTPGATCYIEFTKDGETKKLAARVADSNGTVLWDWTASDFSSGTWTVIAVASLNGQTKTSQDSQPLEIQ
ncbi:MAG TPA: hypothetical protein VLE51_00945 [Candidatus Saccharimonadales bacterium]|nr:hypothetical protein [Candidatus Saccharimonadales bacterium]